MLLIAGLIVVQTATAQVSPNLKFVNPFIGNTNNGHTFPGATVPFGMVQPSPETGNSGWDYCSGYQYTDKEIWGFAQTHLSGTGCPDLGDILLQPFADRPDSITEHSHYDKSSEHASPGYYTVELTDNHVKAELTATAHVAFHRYQYFSNKAHLLVDLQSGIVFGEKQLHEHVLESNVTFQQSGLSGFSHVTNWVDRKYFFTICFNKPIAAKRVLDGRPGEKGARYILDFDIKPGEKLLVKIGMSTVSIDGARNNMKQEAPGWDFDVLRARAAMQWSKYLSRVQVTGDIHHKTTFYTSLYHLLLQPNNIADVDGSYRGPDDHIYKSNSKVYYSTLSLWDTHRAAHPLYTILTPELVNGFVNTMIDHFDHAGTLPMWSLWGKDNYCMIGDHAIPVIVDAYLKGFRGFDAQRAFRAIQTTLTTDHLKSSWSIYDKYGYLPFDLVKEESASRTLEMAYDNYAAMRMAKALGKKTESEFFEKRSQAYRQLFDPSTLFMRGKNSAGQWREPFDVIQISHAGDAGGDYTEGNAWQYTWSVQHDVKGLESLFGGAVPMAKKLDSLFHLPSETKGAGFTGDVTGLIGQYAHGNEPCHHVAYLFTLLGKPSETDKLVRSICDKFYIDKPDGLCGNDDCGQMSAWYLFTAMGFYPVNPVGGDYVFGAPQFQKITLSLPSGRKLFIEAKGISEKNLYVKKIIWNGKPYNQPEINHRELIKGGHLVFLMTDRPAKVF